jgi:hypothetical protein
VDLNTNGRELRNSFKVLFDVLMAVEAIHFPEFRPSALLFNRK